MSDDEENKRGSKDNTGHEHKPDNAQDNDNAPKGHLGTGAPGLGLGGTSSPRQRSEAGEQTQGSNQEQPDNGQPNFAETGDKEVDEHYQKDHNMIGKDDPQHPDNQEKEAAAERPQISQSEFAQRFRAARDHTQSMQQSQDNELE